MPLIPLLPLRSFAVCAASSPVETGLAGPWSRPLFRAASHRHQLHSSCWDWSWKFGTGSHPPSLLSLARGDPSPHVMASSDVARQLVSPERALGCGQRESRPSLGDSGPSVCGHMPALWVGNPIGLLLVKGKLQSPRAASPHWFRRAEFVLLGTGSGLNYPNRAALLDPDCFHSSHINASNFSNQLQLCVNSKTSCHDCRLIKLGKFAVPKSVSACLENFFYITDIVIG